MRSNSNYASNEYFMPVMGLIFLRHAYSRYLAVKDGIEAGLPTEAYEAAIRQVVGSLSTQSLVATNKDKYALIRDGVQVSFRNEMGERVKERLRLIDFEDHRNNHFLCVRELWVRGSLYRRRADIVGFINGLPLLFIECKNIHHNLKAAFEKNFSDYLDTVPHLFHHNAVVLFGNGEKAKVGSITSKWGHFHEWKRLAEEEPGVVDMETLLKGVCKRENLLDLVENFILFDESSGETKKILARNHQFLGVNRALDAVRGRRERMGKLGVFWHTQGAGKSYSMVMFTRKVHRKLGGNFSFVVLTDRDDLDTQIYKTFAGCGVVDHDRDPCRAASGRHLGSLMQEHKAYVFSLIQKFNQEVDRKVGYTPRDDIIVITDEAHRTQYILRDDAEALVNTVNCVGVMGRGIALQFKNQFPDNFKAYATAHKDGLLMPGRMFIHETGELTNPKYIINFPTKRHWRGKSRMEDIDSGLEALVADIRRFNIRSIAIPPLGSGLGGLDWSDVRQRIEVAMQFIPEVEVRLYEPSGAPEADKMVRNREVSKMTAGRAALVELIDRYLSGLLDPMISLLEVHKLMYFMQEAGQPLRLKYEKGTYGPYAANLRHVLNHVEGHLVSGYADGGDNPEKQLKLVPGAVEDARNFLEDDSATRERFTKVSELVEGFESPFGLELLATVHWIAKNEKANSFIDLQKKTYDWNDRKKQFSPRQLELAANALSRHGWISDFGRN